MARIRNRQKKQKETGIKHNKGKLTGRNQRKISRGTEQKKKRKKNRRVIRQKITVEITKNEIIVSFRKSEKEKKVR